MTPEADVTVIGAGASGLCAAIFAGRFARKVVVAEHMPSPGKKLLLTGNGKCNLSNLDLSTAYYHGAGRDFLSAAFGRFDGLKTREFFLSLGVPFRNKDGYLYPLCEEAHGVLQALLNECSRLGVSLNYNIGIRKISPVSGGFLLDTKEGEVFSRRVILATGGAFRKETGSDGSGLLYLTGELEHPVVPTLPALLPLYADFPYLKEVQGVRTRGTITLRISDGTEIKDTGELQLADYGLSGIPVFQVSREAVKALAEKKTVQAELDLLPNISEAEAFLFYRDLFFGREESTASLLYGTIHRKLIPVLLALAGLSDTLPAGELSEDGLRRLLQAIKHLSMKVTGHAKPDMAQCTAGGVDTACVEPSTMESKLVPGFYFCGEVLDVDGICGGYNLQWAWTSGAVAGMSAGMNAGMSAGK